MRRLRIQPDEARRFQQLAGSMLYPGWQLRATGERIKKNRLGQSRLWTYGISGDLPIALITIGESRDLSVVRQMLQAHAYWRLQGLKVDLVILNQEAVSYEQTLTEELKRLVQGYAVHTGIDAPGGIFLRNADQMPDEDFTLFLAAARVGPGGRAWTTRRAARRHAAPGVGVPAAFEDTINGGRALCAAALHGTGLLQRPGGIHRRREGIRDLPGAGYLDAGALGQCHGQFHGFGTLISESGFGFHLGGQQPAKPFDRLGQRSSCATLLPKRSIFAMRRAAPSGRRLRCQSCELDAYRARHGAGYTVFEHNSHAIEQEMTVFVPQDDAGGDPLCIKRLRLRNDGSRLSARLAVTFYVEWTLGEQLRGHPDACVHRTGQAVAGDLRPQPLPLPWPAIAVSFAATSPRLRIRSAADRQEFLGRNGNMADPAAYAQSLSCQPHRRPSWTLARPSR